MNAAVGDCDLVWANTYWIIATFVRGSVDSVDSAWKLVAIRTFNKRFQLAFSSVFGDYSEVGYVTDSYALGLDSTTVCAAFLSITA